MQGKGRTKRQQAEERREQLLDAALVLFAERGLAGATVKDLAAATGTAQGLIYHYFPGKEALLIATVERHSFLPALRATLAAAPGLPVAAVLPDLLHAFSALLGENVALVRLFFREAQAHPAITAHLDAMIAEGVAVLASYLAARVAAGELRQHDVAVAARTLLYTVAMLHLTRIPAADFIPALVEQHLRGIRLMPG